MSENEKRAETEVVPEAATPKPTVDTITETTTTTTATPTKKSSLGKVIAAILVVAVVILGVLYLLEKEGRSSTHIFASLIANQEANKVVAVVNGKDITNSELATSIKQFSQAAAAQGVDTNSPEAQAEIRTQALDVLVNTELLKQAAADAGLSIDDEAVAERVTEIENQIGGAEVLAERMTALGLDEERLKKDVRDELLIQQLLDSIYTDNSIEITDEEVQKAYDDAGGEAAGIPALEEVRDQVVAQIQASKEQIIVDEYLSRLKEKAEVKIIK